MRETAAAVLEGMCFKECCCCLNFPGDDDDGGGLTGLWREVRDFL